MDIDSLKQRAITRTFRAWMEDWEKDAMTSNDPVSERKLLEKYKGLAFCDEDTEGKPMLTCHSDNLQWNKKVRGSNGYTGWHLIMVGEDGSEDAWEINDDICSYIACSRQNVTGLEIIRKTAQTVDEEGKEAEEKGEGDEENEE